MNEKELRAELVAISDRAAQISREAMNIFRTSGWVKTEDELPPEWMKVVDQDMNWVRRNGDEHNGDKWLHENGTHSWEDKVAPRMWFAIPACPKP